MTKTIERSIDLSVPARTAYNQWTQFEDFPQFMPGIKAAQQLDDRHVRWEGELAGERVAMEWEICEQIPDKRIAWTSVSGPWNAGVATFHRIADDRCRVMLQLDYEDVPGFGGSIERAVEDDLLSFKSFLEERGEATGAWRGTIPSKDDE